MTIRLLPLALLALLPCAAAAAAPPIGPHDWPTYNRDVRGWRFNDAEKTLTPATVPGLVEKWRFPAKGSERVVGAFHTTPTVVNGHVYIGTASYPTFYKIRPNGEAAWSFPIPASAAKGSLIPEPEEGEAPNRIATERAILSSALVTDTHVYFGTNVGVFYALDRFTGKEKWKVDAKAKPFPDAHPINVFMSSPILADGKVIVGGGGYEHPYPLDPNYPCCTGRGFVIALDPDTGKLLWKYEVGPKPKKFKKPVVVEDGKGKHTFTHGPATSSVWSTPSYDPATGQIFFGTDVQNSPREPTKDDPRLDTKYSSAVVSLDAATGKEKWVTQINKGDIFNLSMSPYDPETKTYKDLSIGDTPKLHDIEVEGKKTRVVGVGCKDGGYYVFRARDGKLLAHTPVFKGEPKYPLTPKPSPRMLALPSPIGGLQTGCASDGRRVYTNGIDHLQIESSLPTGGRVTAISPSAHKEYWRHERPLIVEKLKIGDPVGAGIALAGGVAYFTTTMTGRLVALDTAKGTVLKEIPVGTLWSGPSVSRGRVYVGTGSILFYGKASKGALYSFGLPGKDAVDALGKGAE